ncbi:MAG: DUF1428 domain-containing protein [Hyphomonadaceae bacterium]|nr:DUF1428 domain-containing protein [Hyphomonadaceae bacterium]
MAYVDGFLIPVPTKGLSAYRKLSKQAGEVWMDHGALDYKECVGDDLTPAGVTATFPQMLKLKRGESVIFAWIVYASKAARDRIQKKAMNDPRLQGMQDCPFDPKRMLVGGFEAIVDMAPAKKPPARKKTATKKKGR